MVTAGAPITRLLEAQSERVSVNTKQSRHCHAEMAPINCTETAISLRNWHKEELRTSQQTNFAAFFWVFYTSKKTYFL